MIERYRVLIVEIHKKDREISIWIDEPSWLS
jgi:hypothetical protein